MQKAVPEQNEESKQNTKGWLNTIQNAARSIKDEAATALQKPTGSAPLA